MTQTEVRERKGLPSDLELHLVNNIEEAWAFKRWASERHDCLGFDTETSGLDPRAPDAKLRLLQIGDRKTGWAIPWELWGGVGLEILNEYDGDWVAHNLAFDARWLEIHAGWKVPWHRAHDTMIMAQTSDPLGGGALKPLSIRHVDRRAGAGDAMLKEAMSKEGWGWGDIPVDYEAYWAYGALDPVLTVHLKDHFNTDKEYPRVYELEMAARRVISRMEDNGARIDIEYCEQKLEQLTNYVDQSKQWGKDNLGISIGSDKQLVRYFTETLGANITRQTKGGSPSVDKAQLKLFLNTVPDTPIAQLAQFILDVRKADKLAGTYFSNFLSMHNDGILHPSVKTLGARTGRMSITNPALQTLPKGEAVVRDAFIPHEGHVLISSDYSQIEMRLMAHFSQDEKLIATFKEADANGSDFFTTIGSDIYNTNMTKEDKRRGLVKNTMYGKCYGAGTNKMAETAGVPYDQMKSVVDAFDTRYPGVKNFQRQVEDVGVRRERAEGQGYVMTPFGRRLPCDEGKVYALTNYMLQGHAAELLKDAIVRLDLAGFSDAMLLPVHDEIIFSVPKEDAEEAMQTIKEVMSITGMAVDIPAEPEGPLSRWGQRYANSISAQEDFIDG
jgi:DNA polymerase-1